MGNGQKPKNKFAGMQRGTKSAHEKIGKYLMLARFDDHLPPWPPKGTHRELHGENRAFIFTATGVTVHLRVKKGNDDRYLAQIRFDPPDAFQELVEVKASGGGEPTLEDTIAALWTSIADDFTEEDIRKILVSKKLL